MTTVEVTVSDNTPRAQTCSKAVEYAENDSVAMNSFFGVACTHIKNSERSIQLFQLAQPQMQNQ